MKMRLAVVGFVSLCGQVVLLREINVVFFGNELSYVLCFGVWLAGTALGTVIASPGRAEADRLGTPSLPPTTGRTKYSLSLPAGAELSRKSVVLPTGSPLSSTAFVEPVRR